MMAYLLLLMGITVLGLGFWSRGRGSRSWRNRILVGSVIVLSAIYLIWRA